MIVDLEQAGEAAAFEGDVCIVGSGAAGLALADEFLHTSRRVILLESGGRNHEPPTQQLYESEITGLPFNGHLTGRFRIFGGSTTRWGGQALPFSPLDFEPRDWVAHSGWPIRFADLAPYYARASRFMRLDPLNYDADLLALLRTTQPGFDPAQIYYHFSKWSPHPDLWRLYRPAIQESATLTMLLHANLTRLVLNEGLDRVQEVHVRTLGGKAAVVRARHVILCLGGIEVARVLLANNTQQKNGLGNDRDLVGRFFQDHLLADIGVLKTSALDRLQHFFNTYYHRGLKYAPRFSAADDLQRRDRILNISAFLEFETSPDSAYVAAKEAYQQLRRRWINGALLRKLAQCALHLPELLRPVYAYLVQHRAYSPAVVPHVRILSEQEPTAESRISLSESKDALGMPRSRIHWQLTELTRHTLTRYAEVLRAEFARTGLGELQPPEWLRDGGTDWRRWVSDSYHHMGAARMHDSPAQGVVNRDCRVHGLDNLYVGSSAVFPTSSHSNPTLTLLALSLRLADHVRQRLETESPGV